MAAAVILLVIPAFSALIGLLLAENSEWRERRRFSRLVKASIERERNPKPKRGYRFVHAGFSMKRR